MTVASRSLRSAFLSCCLLGCGAAFGQTSTDPCTTGTVATLTTTVPSHSDFAVAVQDDLVPGDGHYGQSFPLPLPEGRGGITPELVARYVSSGGNGVLGPGWTFELGAIELSRRLRVTLDRPEYELHLPSAVSRLVPCATPAGEFRSEVESNFFRLRQIPDGSGTTSWSMTARNGTQYLFGSSPSSRVADSGGTHIVRWALTKVIDVHGNFLDIDYRTDLGTSLPSEIRYAGHMSADGRLDVAPAIRITFTWEPRGDTITSFRFGARQRLDQRLKEVAVQGGGKLQRTFRFSYDRSRATGRPLLANLTTAGADGSEDSPIRFNYSEPALVIVSPDFNIPFTGTAQWIKSDRPGTDASKSSLRFGDVDADGRTDACLLSEKGYECFLSQQVETDVTTTFFDKLGEHELVERHFEYRFTSSIGGPAWTGPQWRDLIKVAAIRLVDLNADGRMDVCGRDADGVICALSPGRSVTGWTSFRGPAWKDADGWNDLSTGGTMSFPDLNADGLADICARARNGVVCAFGTGSGFGPEFDGPPFSNAGGWNGSGRFATISYPDLDGDGRADICGRAATGIVCARFDGLKFSSLKNTLLAWSDAAGWTAASSHVTIAFPDLNGDGLADACGRKPDGNLQCALGTGDDFTEAVNAPTFPDSEGWGHPSQFASFQFADVNHDGLADLCGRTQKGWRCWRGNASDLVPYSQSPLLGDDSDWKGDDRGSTLRIADVDGGGNPSVCGRGTDGPVCMHPSSNAWELLSEWTNGRGGSWKLTYDSSAKFDNLRLPLVLPVLRIMEMNAGLDVVEKTTFSYAGGAMNLRERDFRGFAFLRITGPEAQGSGPARIREFWFHQGDHPNVLPWHFQASGESWLFEMSRADEPLAGEHDHDDPFGSLRGRAYRTIERDTEHAYYEEHLLTYRADPNGAPFYQPLVRDDALFCIGTDCLFPLPTAPDPIFKGNEADFQAQLVARLKADRTRAAFAASSFRRLTTWTYDEVGNVLELAEAGDPTNADDDRVTRMTYQNDTEHWLLGLKTSQEVLEGTGSSVHPLSRTTFTYDQSPVCLGSPALAALPRGLLTGEERWDGATIAATSHYDYDAFGNSICIQDAEGRAQRTEFDATTRSRKVVETNDLGHRRTYTWHGISSAGDAGAYGQLATVVDEAGGITRLTYDTLGRLRRIQRPQNAVEEIVLINIGDAKKQRIRRTKPAGNFEETRFDGAGRTVQRTESAAEGKTIVEDIRYDGRGIISSRSYPHFDGEPARNMQITSNAQGKIVQVRHPDSRVEQWCRSGRQMIFTDASGRKHLEETDGLGRVRKVANLVAIPPTPKPPSGPITNPVKTILEEPLVRPCGLDELTTAGGFETLYRADDFPHFFTDAAGNRTELLYDALARHTGTRYPNGAVESATFDRSDQRVTETDARGAIHRFHYDAIGRLESEAWTLGAATRTVRYQYDQGALGTGRLSSITSPEESISFGYDALGRVTDQVHRIGGRTFAFAFEFDGEGRPVREQYPNGLRLRMIYDGPQLTDVLDSTQRLLKFSSFSPTRIARRVEYGNGIVIDRTLSGDSGAACTAVNFRLCDETAHQGTTTLLSRHYVYEPSGLIRHVDENDGTLDYEYDEQGQLTRATHADSAAATHVEHFRYDRIRSVVEKGQTLLTYSGGSLLPEAASTIGGEPAHYDGDGRLLQWHNHQWSFDAAGRLVTAQRNGESLSLTYDPYGRLFSSVLGTDERLRLNPDADCTSSGCTSFVVVGGRRLVSRAADGHIEYAVHDHLGSLRLVTDDNGNLLKRYDYDAFGEPVERGSAAVEPLDHRRFAGMEWFPALGIANAGLRWYVPEAALFPPPDPAPLAIFTVRDFNAYGYAGNNPVSFQDENGMTSVPAAFYAAELARQFQAAHPVAANITFGTGLAVIGVIGMFTSMETLNPSMAYESALLFGAGSAQLAVGLTEAFSSPQTAAQLQKDWSSVSDLLDPDKIFAGAIAEALGLDKRVGYLGVDIFKTGKGIKDLTQAPKSKNEGLLGIGNFVNDANSFLDKLTGFAEKRESKPAEKIKPEHEPKDPFKNWEPKEIFRGGTPQEPKNPVA